MRKNGADFSFDKFKVIYNQNHNALFIDFSMNNYYLMFQKEKESVVLVTLTDLSKEDVKLSELHLQLYKKYFQEAEWMGRGIFFTEQVMQLQEDINQSDLFCMKKYDSQYYFLTDYSGSIRIFNT